MLDERPDLVRRLISGSRMPEEEKRPEPAGAEEVLEHTQPTLLPETQRALQRMLPQLNQEDLRSTFKNAMNGPNEKGH